MSDAPITWFDGTEYDFLSNFHPSEIPWTSTQGFVPGATLAPTVEHAYQAEKATTHHDYYRIITATQPGTAKRIGQTIKLRPDWEVAKFNVMRMALRSKFSIPHLQEQLLATGDRWLKEGNSWHDDIWGDCTCEEHRYVAGQNHLGRMLMEVRLEIRKAMG